jgi:hypothetical protein
MSDGGKGSLPRPIPDPKKFEENWNLIFGKPKKEQQNGQEQNNSGRNQDSK